MKLLAAQANAWESGFRRCKLVQHNLHNLISLAWAWPTAQERMRSCEKNCCLKKLFATYQRGGLNLVPHLPRESWSRSCEIWPRTFLDFLWPIIIRAIFSVAVGGKQYLNPKAEQTMWVAFIDHLKTNEQLPVVAFTLSRNRYEYLFDLRLFWTNI